MSEGIINSGYFVFNKEIFDYLSPDERWILKMDLSKDCKDDELRAYS